MTRTVSKPNVTDGTHHPAKVINTIAEFEAIKPGDIYRVGLDGNWWPWRIVLDQFEPLGPAAFITDTVDHYDDRILTDFSRVEPELVIEFKEAIVNA